PVVRGLRIKRWHQLADRNVERAEDRIGRNLVRVVAAIIDMADLPLRAQPAGHRAQNPLFKLRLVATGSDAEQKNQHDPFRWNTLSFHRDCSPESQQGKVGVGSDSETSQPPGQMSES